MKLDEQQLMDAQIIIVNEEECNDHIMDILTTCDNYKEAIDVVEDYIYDECDCYLQEINPGVGFHSTREGATAIAKVVLTHFGWEESKKERTNSTGVTELNSDDKQKALNFILNDEEELKYITAKIEESAPDVEVIRTWLQTHIHGGLDSFFTNKFNRRICTSFEDIAKIVEQLLSHFVYQKTPEELQEEIKQHMSNAEEIFDRVDKQLNQLKEKHIMPTVTIQTIHEVNGQDVTTLSRDELHESIKQLEAEIESLKNIKVKSKSVTLAIKEAKKALRFVVKHVDSKVK